MHTPHWHASVDQILLYGLSAIVVFNVVRLIAIQVSKVDNPAAQTVGGALGALVGMEQASR